MKAIFRHELTMFYHGLSGYVFGAFLLIFTGIGALIYNINASVANFEYVLSFISIVFVIIVPVITMKTIAEEKKQKTDLLLYSLPISSAEIVVGKFLALAVILAIPTVIISFYPVIFSMFGEVYLPTSYGSIVAFFLLGLALMSIGMFISSLTESMGMAAGITVAVMLLIYFSSTLADYVSSSAIGSLIFIIVVMILLGLVIRAVTKLNIAGICFSVITCIAAAAVYFLKPELLEDLLPQIMNKISLFARLSIFVNGVFDITGIIYFLSVTVFFLFLCIQSLERKRYNG